MLAPPLQAVRTAALVLAFPLSAAATPLPPGGATLVTGTTVAADPDLAGSVLNDNLILYDFDPAPLFLAGHDVQNRVTRSAATGNLIFGPRFAQPYNITPFDFLIDGFEITGFGDFATDVAYRTDGVGDRGPTFAERSADGDVLRFTFGFPLVLQNLVQEVQETSYFMSIVTDAKAFAPTGRMTIFGRSEEFPGQIVTASIGGIAVPVDAPVPLPAPAALLLAGLGALAALQRRRG